MTDRIQKIPGPNHPITIEPAKRRVRVTVNDVVVADTTNALVLREANYPAVLYIPRKDAVLAEFERSDHTSYCPYKGQASYFGIPAGGAKSIDAIWTYETPYDAVRAIAGHLAFYPDRVDTIEEI